MLKADVLVREALGKINARDVCGRHRDRTVAGGFSLDNKNFPPRTFIGRKGEGADKIKAQIIGIMKKIKTEIPKEIKLTVEEIQHPESSAMILAQMAAENLEKERPFEER